MTVIQTEGNVAQDSPPPPPPPQVITCLCTWPQCCCFTQVCDDIVLQETLLCVFFSFFFFGGYNYLWTPKVYQEGKIMTPMQWFLFLSWWEVFLPTLSIWAKSVPSLFPRASGFGGLYQYQIQWCRMRCTHLSVYKARLMVVGEVQK